MNDKNMDCDSTCMQTDGRVRDRALETIYKITGSLRTVGCRFTRNNRIQVTAAGKNKQRIRCRNGGQKVKPL